MEGRPPRQPAPPQSTDDLPSSLTLISRAQGGDRAALDTLLGRYLPRLQRWASGRLPRWARDMSDTQDLVQETLAQAFQKIGGFEVRGDGALYAYLRQAILNRIRDQLRRAKRRPASVEVDADVRDNGLSPLEAAIGRDALERYERGLATLRPEDREAVIARVELGYTYAEIAELVGKPTPNAARMAVERAILRLAAAMRPGQP